MSRGGGLSRSWPAAVPLAEDYHKYLEWLRLTFALSQDDQAEMQACKEEPGEHYKEVALRVMSEMQARRLEQMEVLRAELLILYTRASVACREMDAALHAGTSEEATP